MCTCWTYFGVFHVKQNNNKYTGKVMSSCVCILKRAKERERERKVTPNQIEQKNAFEATLFFGLVSIAYKLKPQIVNSLKQIFI